MDLPTTTFPEITLELIQSRVGIKNVERGEEYVQTKAVSELSVQGSMLRATCQGTSTQPYKEWIQFDAKGILDAHCSCPVGEKGNCKHIAAVLLSFKSQKANKSPRKRERDKDILENTSSKSPIKSNGENGNSYLSKFSAYGFQSPSKKVKPTSSPFKDTVNLVSNETTTPNTSQSDKISKLNSLVSWLRCIIKIQRNKNFDINAKYLQASSELNELKAKMMNESSKIDALTKQLNEKDQRLKAVEQDLNVLNIVCSGMSKKVESISNICKNGVNPRSIPPLVSMYRNSPHLSSLSESMEEDLLKTLAETEKTNDHDKSPTYSVSIPISETTTNANNPYETKEDEETIKQKEEELTPYQLSNSLERELSKVLSKRQDYSPSSQEAEKEKKESESSSPLKSLIQKYLSTESKEELKRQNTSATIESLFFSPKKQNQNV